MSLVNFLIIYENGETLIESVDISNDEDNFIITVPEISIEQDTRKIKKKILINNTFNLLKINNRAFNLS